MFDVATAPELDDDELGAVLEALLLVVDDGPWSYQTAARVGKLAADIGYTPSRGVIQERSARRGADIERHYEGRFSLSERDQAHLRGRMANALLLGK